MGAFLRSLGQEDLAEALASFLDSAAEGDFSGYTTPSSTGFQRGPDLLHVAGATFKIRLGSEESTGSWGDFKKAQSMVANPDNVEYLGDDVQRAAMSEALHAVQEDDT